MLSPITGITTVTNPSAEGRVFKVRLKGIDSPVPLGSLGGGLVRVFHLAVALEYSYLAKENRQASLFGETENVSEPEPSRLLLIDEIENGIHHTIHSTLWRAVFRLAREHNVQVFATTHSLDCLRGFAAAVAESEENDGLAIRLEKVEGEEQTGAVIIDREDLPIVVRDSIEVR
jgi:hypothetical protein